MSLLASQRQTTRLMVYAMVCTLVISFGSIGAIFASNIAPQYALMGLFLGSALGAFISVYESTIIGCMAGMITGLAVSPLVYVFIDFETAYLVVFILALFGAIMGEPLAYFWREAEEISEEQE
ncbi:MAG: hypothetical protein PWR01_2055 [Clostridiales bacterium]|nr:hypothetical protein [Clostridiales bacterium]MDN5280982.1 hypothetical protein [Candidatus Ozemobacter sp.]